jgi:hypothetical protein
MTGIGIDKVNPRVVGEFGTARFGRLLWSCPDLKLNHVWLSAIGDKPATLARSACGRDIVLEPRCQGSDSRCVRLYRGRRGARRRAGLLCPALALLARIIMLVQAGNFPNI